MTLMRAKAAIPVVPVVLVVHVISQEAPNG